MDVILETGTGSKTGAIGGDLINLAVLALQTDRHSRRDSASPQWTARLQRTYAKQRHAATGDNSKPAAPAQQQEADNCTPLKVYMQAKGTAGDTQSLTTIFDTGSGFTFISLRQLLNLPAGAVLFRAPPLPRVQYRQ